MWNGGGTTCRCAASGSRCSCTPIRCAWPRCSRTCSSMHASTATAAARSRWRSNRCTDGTVTVRVIDAGIGIRPGRPVTRVRDVLPVGPLAGARARVASASDCRWHADWWSCMAARSRWRAKGLHRGSQFIVRLPVRGGPPSGHQPPRSGTPRRTARRDPGAGGRRQRRCSNDAGEPDADRRAPRSRSRRDGMEALEIAESFRPQVILLDIGLPN